MKFKFSICALFAVCLISTAANAALWTTTDGNVNIVQVDFAGSNQYGLFDDEDSALSTPLLLAPGATVVISENAGQWTAEYGNDSIDLGPTGCFDFAWMDLTGAWNSQYSISSFSSDQYQLIWDNNPNLFIVADAKPECNPVPIPAAGYLLFAGMAGLVSARKFGKK